MVQLQRSSSPQSGVREPAHRDLERGPRQVNLDGLHRVLFAFVAAVIALHLIAATLAVTGAQLPGAELFIRMASVDSETSLGTWLNTLLLVLASAFACVCWLVSRQLGRRGALGWLGVSVVVLLASIDEIVQLHESLNYIGERLVPDSGLEWPWVILGGIVVLGLAVVFAPFILRLAPAVRWWLVAGAACYVCGAIGMELVSAPFYPGEHQFTPVYAVLNAAEEALEMTGVVLVVMACIRQLRLLGGVHLTVGGAGRDS